MNNETTLAIALADAGVPAGKVATAMRLVDVDEFDNETTIAGKVGALQGDLSTLFGATPPLAPGPGTPARPGQAPAPKPPRSASSGGESEYERGRRMTRNSAFARQL